MDLKINEQCSKEGHKNMAKKQIKRYLILPIIRKIKTTEVLLHTHQEDYYYYNFFFFLREKRCLARLWRTVGEDAEKMKPLHRQQEGKIVQPLWIAGWQFLNNYIQNQHIIQHFHFWVEMKTNSKRCVHHNVCPALFYNSQAMRATQVPINR